ncbi:MAG: N5-glutamine methyltransferase family protein [Moorellales bacterium]
MIVAEVLRQTACRLKARAGAAARLEAELLLAEVRGQSRARLLAELRRPVSSGELAVLEYLVTRRLEGEPVAYLLGRREFMSLEFRVGPGVLVPRPETETLVEKALEILRRGRRRRPVVADVGTGCGNLALSVAYYFPRARIVATELSSAALRWARLNARRLGLSHRVKFYRGDLLRPLLSRRGAFRDRVPRYRYRGYGTFPRRSGLGGSRARSLVSPPAGRSLRSKAGPVLLCPGGPPVPAEPDAGGSRGRRGPRVDFVLANLPYIPTGHLKSLPPEVQREPRLALDGGSDGLDLYRRLLRQLGGVLRPGGHLVLEMSPEQEDPLRRLLVAAGFRRVGVIRDGAGRPRGFCGRFFPVKQGTRVGL